MIFLPQQATLTDEITAILDRPALRSSVVGIHVVDKNGKELAAINADRRLMPASNQKLLSCLFALEAAGPDWRPTTRFWRQGSTITVASEGDPGMTYARLKEIRARLGGGRKVRVQQDYRPGWLPSWPLDYLPNRYAAPVTAFGFDQGAFEIWNVNGKAQYRPEAFGATIVEGPELSYDPIKGVSTVPKLEKKTERLDTLSITNPDEAAASLFGPHFESVTTVPSSAPTITVPGNTIAELVEKCLPPSDNLIAENLMLLAAGRRNATRPMTYGIARNEMFRFLTKEVGLIPTDLNISDGSGLSRLDLVTPRALTSLLRWAETRPYGPLYRSAMASPSKGTLRRRLQGVDFQGKTGSLSMVVGLSGYLRTKKGDDVTVSILLNHYPGDGDVARAAADDIIRAIDAR